MLLYFPSKKWKRESV